MEARRSKPGATWEGSGQCACLKERLQASDKWSLVLSSIGKRRRFCPFSPFEVPMWCGLCEVQAGEQLPGGSKEPGERAVSACVSGGAEVLLPWTRGSHQSRLCFLLAGSLSTCYLSYKAGGLRASCWVTVTHSDPCFI